MKVRKGKSGKRLFEGDGVEGGGKGQARTRVYAGGGKSARVREARVTPAVTPRMKRGGKGR